MKRYLLVLGMVALLLSCTSALAVYTYDFVIFTDNGDYNDDPGVDLYFELSEVGGQAQFQIYNNSTVECTITKVFFDAINLAQIASIVEPEGVSFYTGTGAPNFQAGNELMPPFETTESLWAFATPPPAHEGVKPGEWVKLIADMENAVTIEDINASILDGQTRVGLHITSFEDGSSESGINVIPEPSLIGLGLLGSIGLLKRFGRKDRLSG